MRNDHLTVCRKLSARRNNKSIVMGKSSVIILDKRWAILVILGISNFSKAQ